MKKMSNFVLANTVELATVAIRVKDRDKMIAFYRDLIGFDLKREENALAIMGTLNSKEGILWLEESPRADDHFGKVKKLRSMTLIVPSIAELSDVYTRLQKAEYPIAEVAFSENRASFTLIDPEENQLELTAHSNEKVQNIEELVTAGTGECVHLSEGTQVKKVHLNVRDSAKEAAFLANQLGVSPIEKDSYQVVEQNFFIDMTETESDAIDIASHEIIGLEFLKFLIDADGLAALEQHLQEIGQEYFVDKKKNILTVYDSVGVEWWFVRKK